LPPNSPEDHLREEFHEENYFEARSIVTPLLECLEGDNFQEGFVLPANPPLKDPFGPLLIRVNFVRELELDTDYPHLPLAPCEHIMSMETKQIHSYEFFTTPSLVSGPSNPMKTLEKPLNILNLLDTTIDYDFKLLQ
jgi:hypothetical protein